MKFDPFSQRVERYKKNCLGELCGELCGVLADECDATTLRGTKEGAIYECGRFSRREIEQANNLAIPAGSELDLKLRAANIWLEDADRSPRKIPA